MAKPCVLCAGPVGGGGDRHRKGGCRTARQSGHAAWDKGGGSIAGSTSVLVKIGGEYRRVRRGEAAAGTGKPAGASKG